MMDERIEKLVNLSYETVQSPSGEGYREFNKERFAKLILKECLTLIDGKIADLDEYAVAGDEFIERSLGAYLAKEVIMDYFGVK